MKKRADGRWCLTKVVNGKRRYFYSYEKTERKAFIDIQRQIEEDEKKASRSPSFSNIAWEWFEERRKEIAESTAGGYYASVRDMCDYFGSARMADIGAADLSEWVQKIIRRGYKGSTVKYKMIIMSSIFQYAVNNEYIDNNPMLRIKTPRLPKDAPRKPAPKDAEAYIREHPDEWLFPYFLLMTGMRRGEVLALKWGDIDFREKTISVTKSVMFRSMSQS